MQFILLISGDENAINAATPVDETGMSPEYAAYNDALMKAGVIRGGERLRPTGQSKRVRVRDGKAVVLDGPYSDTQEQLGGYYIIDVPTIEEAVTWAERLPAAKFGTIDVRPIWPTGRE